jgi:tetratricopeptide (TPR) repeat protein
MSGTVTVLFTDLVGSTDLLARLGEAAFDEVRRAHFSTLREAIHRHGGDEIKTLGDGVLAVFGSAADAVNCAVAMQQAVARRNLLATTPVPTTAVHGPTPWGVDTEKVAVLESAVATYPSGDSPIRARLLANLGQELIFAGDGNRHLDLTEEALAMARRLEDTATLAYVLLARGNAIFSDPPWLDEFLANSAELLALAEELGDAYLKAYAEHHRFSAAFHAGLVEEADRALEATERTAEEAGQPILRWWAAIDRAGRVLAAGRIAEAEALIAEVLELGLATGQPDARQYHATLRFEMLYDSGRLVEDLDRLSQAHRLSQRPVLGAMLALASSETGHDEEARDLLEPLVPMLPELSMPLGTWFRTVVPAALASARLADPALALPLYDLLLPFADLITGVYIGWSGSASQHLGMLATVLGRFDDAEQHFATAEATHERIGAQVWLARSHLEWARTLLTRRAPQDPESARVLLDRALDSARRLGLAKVESDAVSMLGEFPVGPAGRESGSQLG